MLSEAGNDTTMTVEAKTRSERSLLLHVMPGSARQEVKVTRPFRIDGHGPTSGGELVSSGFARGEAECAKDGVRTVSWDNRRQKVSRKSKRKSYS